MTGDDHTRAVQLNGFTERQAGFLVAVMRYAGVCLGRQYCAFAQIAYGRTMHDFFQRLLVGGYATARRCGHNRARLYHVHAKALYRAIDEPDSRHRRPMTLARAVERLMVLDAVLADRELTWLGSEREKVTRFTLVHGVPRRDLPQLVFRAPESETVRYFPDKLPIGIDGQGAATFMFLVTRNEPVDFRAFLERHAELLRALPAWTIRVLVPRHKTGAIVAYQAAFREQLTTPLAPGVFDEFCWFVHARRRGGQRGPDERFDQAARAFSAPRFQATYRAFLQRGEPVLDALSSPTLADRVAWGDGRLEMCVLPHNYLRLLELVGTA